MPPSMKNELAARDGDLRLCLLLGIAAWFLFLDHVPHNAVSLLTMRTGEQSRAMVVRFEPDRRHVGV